MVNEIKIDNKGRILLPKEIREKFNLSPGSKLVLQIQKDDILLKPKLTPKKMVKNMRNIRSKIKLRTEVPLSTEKLFE